MLDLIRREAHAYHLTPKSYGAGYDHTPGVVLFMADGTKWFHPETGARPFQFGDASVAGIHYDAEG